MKKKTILRVKVTSINFRYGFFIFCLLLLLNIGMINGQTRINVNTKVFLSGCFENNEMYTDLLNRRLIPLNQPYNISPWNYMGKESVSSIPSDIVDWILIEIRSDSTVRTDQKAVFLRKDGQVVGLDGISLPEFNNLIDGDYYIIIYHRNHLGIMSAEKIPLDQNSTLYDFTDSQLKTYGLKSQKELINGSFGLRAGNGDKNNVINNLDYGTVANNIFNSNYLIPDLDMNGIVNVLDYYKVYANILNQSNIPLEKEPAKELSPDFSVTTLAELQNAVLIAETGNIIQIENDIAFTSLPSSDPVGKLYNSTERLLIEKDVTIQGKSYVERPTLYIDKDINDFFIYFMIEVKSANVTFRNLKLDGRLWRSDFNGGQTQSIDETLLGGIAVGGQSQGSRFWENSSAIMDSCEITGWSNVGVHNNGTTIVKNSYIHHNLKTGAGYGISNGRNGNLTVHNCVFDFNRHNIMHYGDNGMITNIYNNIFYEHGIGYISQIDHHRNTSKSVYSGGLTKIHHNTFYDGESPITYSVGYPYTGIHVYENKFLGTEWAWWAAGSGSGLSDNTDYRPAVEGNSFPSGYTTVTKSQHQGGSSLNLGNYGNYNGGDPWDEVNERWKGGKNWFVSNNYYRDVDWEYNYLSFQVQYEDSSGSLNWNRLAGLGYESSYPNLAYPQDSIGFGDFNGDGVTDIITHYFESEVKKNYGKYVFNAINFPFVDSTHTMISFSGISQWEQLRTHEYKISDMIFADVDGDGETDIIVNDNGYKYAPSGVKSWLTLPNDIGTYTQYTKRDFNGDGEDDNFRISSE